MIKVADAPLNADLSHFSRWLTAQGYVHRITEEQGKQVVFMADDRLKFQVESALQRYLDDPHFREEIQKQLHQHLSERGTFKPAPVALYPRATPAQAPLIFVLIFFSILVAALSDFGQGGPILRMLLIVDPFQLDADLSSFDGRLQGLLETFAKGEIWRLLSPDFIHFNVMHITFNLLMLWILGGQLEIQKGSVAFLLQVIFVSSISNVAQFFDSGYLFGGLSGVVYGLVGYCWVWKRLAPDIFFPDILMKFSLIWLLLGYTPLTEWIGLGRMANSAHLYGLIAGVIWGGITAGIQVKKTPKP